MPLYIYNQIIKIYKFKKERTKKKTIKFPQSLILTSLLPPLQQYHINQNKTSKGKYLFFLRIY